MWIGSRGRRLGKGEEEGANSSPRNFVQIENPFLLKNWIENNIE
jgi:hypothetical protein